MRRPSRLGQGLTPPSGFGRRKAKPAETGGGLSLHAKARVNVDITPVSTAMNPKILIADADDRLGRFYESILTREGYAVEVAAGGADCVTRLRRSRPAVLILDHDLPSGGAGGVLFCLREGGPPFPGIVLTACGPVSEPSSNLPAAPAVFVLQKPFALAALRQAVRFASPMPSPARANGAIPAGGQREKMATPAESDPPVGPSDARKGVLVVDDEAGIRELLRVALPHQGFRVWLAASGQEAVEIYRKQRDKIVAALLDVQMPGPSGPETMEALRQINPRLPCSFMTGCPDSNRTLEWLVQSGVPILPKPFALEKLGQVLRRLAGGGEESPARLGNLVSSC